MVPRKRVLLFIGVLATALAVACGGAATSSAPPSPTATPGQTPVAQAPMMPSPTPTPTSTPTLTPTPGQGSPSTRIESGLSDGDEESALDQEKLMVELRGARFSTREWPNTDFSIRSVPLTDFVGGGPAKDGIPAIGDPKFVPVEEADQWLQDPEAVEVVDINGDVRAYPNQILMWHEIVNDVVGGEPVAITY